MFAMIFAKNQNSCGLQPRCPLLLRLYTCTLH